MPRSVAGQRQLVRDFGTCLLFNGSSGVVNVTSNSTLGTTNTAMTISVWINPKSLGLSNAGRIVDKITTTNGYQFLCAAGNAVGFTVDGTGVTANANAITLKVWQHVVVTYDSTLGSNQMNIYVNGVVVKQGTRTGTFTVDSTTLRIGNRADGIRTFDGYMDDLRIYMNRALSSTEVSDLYYGIEPTTTNLVLWHKYNEGSGSSATDSSPVGTNTGSISTATYSTNVFMKPRTASGTRTLVDTRSFMT